MGDFIKDLQKLQVNEFNAGQVVPTQYQGQYDPARVCGGRCGGGRCGGCGFRCGGRCAGGCGCGGCGGCVGCFVCVGCVGCAPNCFI